MLLKPQEQLALGLGNGPHCRPEGIVEIKADHPDAVEFIHGSVNALNQRHFRTASEAPVYELPSPLLCKQHDDTGIARHPMMNPRPIT
jgi:hypothetical protein